MTTAQQFQQKLAQRRKKEQEELAETLQAENFTLVRELGKGGEGTTYLLETKDSQVVGKILEVENGDATELERLLHEAQVLQHLDHPRITKSGRVVELLELGKIMLTREYIPEEVINETQGKKNLRALLQEKKVLPEAEVVRVMDSVLEILEYLHDPAQHRAIPTAVVHRDVKPENIFVDDQGNAYVTDFGVARITETGKTTATAHVRGTHGYAAPEQYGGGGYPQSDLFGLAVTVLEMLTGEVPEYFRKGYFQSKEFQLPNNFGINSGLKGILEQMVTLEYTERPSSATEVRKMLREKTRYLDDETVVEEVVEGREVVVGGDYSDLEARMQKLAKGRVRAAKYEKSSLDGVGNEGIRDDICSEIAGSKFIQLLEQQGYEYRILRTRRGKFLTSYFTRETADGKVQILMETDAQAFFGRNKAFTGYAYKEAQQGEDIEKLVKGIVTDGVAEVGVAIPIRVNILCGIMIGVVTIPNSIIDTIILGILTGGYVTTISFGPHNLKIERYHLTTGQDEEGNYKAITAALQPRELLTKKVLSQEGGYSPLAMPVATP